MVVGGCDPTFGAEMEEKEVGKDYGLFSRLDKSK